MSLIVGNQYFRDGDLDGAIRQYREVTPDSPLYEQAQLNIARCLRRPSPDDTPTSSACRLAVRDVYSSPVHEKSWTAVITLWKRKDYLREQLDAISSQTCPPSHIVLIQNEDHFTIDKSEIAEFNVTIIRSDLNSLYTRWIIGYLFNTKYVCVFDDDVIPGEYWIESCICASIKYNALIGPSGRRAKPGAEPAWESVETQDGTGDQLCDWVCNSYFFQTDWIKHVVAVTRYAGSQKTFDDIQLATTLKIFGGINTVVPNQPRTDVSRNGHRKRQYGHDEHALWKRQPTEHMLSRSELVSLLDAADFPWAIAR